MGKHINKKNLFNVMNKKIFILIFILMLSVFNAYSLSLQTSQKTNIWDYTLSEKGNRFIYNLVGSIDDTIQTNTSSLNYDFNIEIADINSEFYLEIVNYNKLNTTGQFIFYTNLNENPRVYLQNFTLEREGTYYFKFTPTLEDETGFIYVNMEDPSFVGLLYYEELKPRSFNSLMGTFVSGFVDILNINFLAWEIGFYIALFIISVTFVLSLFGISFILFRYLKKLKDNRNKEGGI